jgi:hypothetical protein
MKLKGKKYFLTPKSKDGALRRLCSLVKPSGQKFCQVALGGAQVKQ